MTQSGNVPASFSIRFGGSAASLLTWLSKKKNLLMLLANLGVPQPERWNLSTWRRRWLEHGRSLTGNGEDTFQFVRPPNKDI